MNETEVTLEWHPKCRPNAAIYTWIRKTEMLQFKSRQGYRPIYEQEIPVLFSLTCHSRAHSAAIITSQFYFSYFFPLSIFLKANCHVEPLDVITPNFTGTIFITLKTLDIHLTQTRQGTFERYVLDTFSTNCVSNSDCLYTDGRAVWRLNMYVPFVTGSCACIRLIVTFGLDKTVKVSICTLNA